MGGEKSCGPGCRTGPVGRIDRIGRQGAVGQAEFAFGRGRGQPVHRTGADAGLGVGMGCEPIHDDEDLNGARARVGGAEVAAADTVTDQLLQPLAPPGLLAADPVAQDGAVAAQVPGVDPQAAECVMTFSGREGEEARESFDGVSPARPGGTRVSSSAPTAWPNASATSSSTTGK